MSVKGNTETVKINSTYGRAFHTPYANDCSTYVHMYVYYHTKTNSFKYTYVYTSEGVHIYILN